MKAFSLGFSAWLSLSLLWIPVLRSEPPPQLADLQGGLVVQVGAEKTDLAVRLSQTGRYLVHLVDLDSSVTEKATKSLRTKGTYGLAFAETLQDFNHLPYAENMVNAVILQSPGKVPLAEGAKWTVDPFTPAEEKDKPYKKGTQLFNDVHAMALAGNDRLYAVHKDGRLKVFDTSNGKVLAERQVPSPIWDGLAIAKGNLFLSTRSGELLCLGAAQ
jgi:hypothetical protein